MNFQTIIGRRSIIAVVVAMMLLPFAALNTYAGDKVAVEHTIEIRDFEFFPENVTVKVGDKVTWINRDFTPHTATAADDSWDTGELKEGQSKTLTIVSNQVLNYYCFYHPTMEAKLTIE